jgi:hypothetical protein
MLLAGDRAAQSADTITISLQIMVVTDSAAKRDLKVAQVIAAISSTIALGNGNSTATFPAFGVSLDQSVAGPPATVSLVALSLSLVASSQQPAVASSTPRASPSLGAPAAAAATSAVVNGVIGAAVAVGANVIYI